MTTLAQTASALCAAFTILARPHRDAGYESRVRIVGLVELAAPVDHAEVLAPRIVRADAFRDDLQVRTQQCVLAQEALDLVRPDVKVTYGEIREELGPSARTLPEPHTIPAFDTGERVNVSPVGGGATGSRRPSSSWFF